MTRIRLDAYGQPQISKFDSMRVMTANGMLKDAKENGYRDKKTGKCKICNGDKEIDLKDEGKTACVCWLLSEERHHRAMQEYATHHPKVEISEFQIWGDASSKASLSEALSSVRRWLAKMDHWLLMDGPVGCGKTHLLHIIDTILNPWSLYISAPDFKDMVFESTGNGNLSTLLDKMAKHPILLIDDVGAEWASDYAVSAMRQVIMARYAKWRDLPTVVVTNLDSSQLIGYDIRLADRLYDDEKVYHVKFSNVVSWRRYGKR